MLLPLRVITQRHVSNCVMCTVLRLQERLRQCGNSPFPYLELQGGSLGQRPGLGRGLLVLTGSMWVLSKYSSFFPQSTILHDEADQTEKTAKIPKYRAQTEAVTMLCIWQHLKQQLLSQYIEFES